MSGGREPKPLAAVLEGPGRQERLRELIGDLAGDLSTPPDIVYVHSVDDSVRVRAADRQGRENISCYLIRAPFSVDKIQYSRREGSVIYKLKIVKGPKRNYKEDL